MNNRFRSPLKILHGRICGDYFRHISQKSSAIHKVFPRIFVSSDEKISRSSPRAEYLEVPFTITAHTGCMGTKMNSLEAITKGIENGADIIEFDLNYNREGTAVLSHDLPSNASPTLDSAFALLEKEKDVKINVDAKVFNDLSIVRETAEKYGILDRVFFTGIFSENVPSVKETNIPYYLNYELVPKLFQTKAYAEKVIAQVKKTGAVGLNVRFSRVSRLLAKEVKSSGLLLSLWTANNENEMKSCIALNPNNITTKRPDLLNKLK